MLWRNTTRLILIAVLAAAQTASLAAQTARPTGTLPAPGPAAAPPATPLEAARQLVERGDYKDAIAKLEALLGSSPTLSMPLLLESLLATGE